MEVEIDPSSTVTLNVLGAMLKQHREQGSEDVQKLFKDFANTFQTNILGMVQSSVKDGCDGALHEIRQRLAMLEQAQKLPQQRQHPTGSGTPGSSRPPTPPLSPRAGGWSPSSHSRSETMQPPTAYAQAAAQDQWAPNTGRGSATSTSASGNFRNDRYVVYNAVVISEIPQQTSARAIRGFLEPFLNKGVDASPEVGPLGFGLIRGLGRHGVDSLRRAAEQEETGGGAAAASGVAGASGAAAAGSPAAAASGSGGATSGSSNRSTRTSADTFSVVAYFKAGWDNGWGWDVAISKAGSVASAGKPWVIKDYLTQEGMKARRDMQPAYDSLKLGGQNPKWKNGVEIWTRAGDRGPLLFNCGPPPPPPPAAPQAPPTAPGTRPAATAPTAAGNVTAAAMPTATGGTPTVGVPANGGSTPAAVSDAEMNEQ